MLYSEKPIYNVYLAYKTAIIVYKEEDRNANSIFEQICKEKKHHNKMMHDTCLLYFCKIDHLNTWFVFFSNLNDDPNPGQTEDSKRVHCSMFNVHASYTKKGEKNCNPSVNPTVVYLLIYLEKLLIWTISTKLW